MLPAIYQAIKTLYDTDVGVGGLSTLTGGRLFREHAPAGTAKPYLVVGTQSDTESDSTGSDGAEADIAFNVYTDWTPTSASGGDTIIARIGTLFHRKVQTASWAGITWNVTTIRAGMNYLAEPEFAHHHVVRFQVIVFPST